MKEVKGSRQRFWPHPMSTAHVTLLSIKQHCQSPETENCITLHTTNVERAFDRHRTKYEVRKKKHLIMKPSQVSAVPNECFLIKWNQYKQVVCGFDFTQKKDESTSLHVFMTNLSTCHRDTDLRLPFSLTMKRQIVFKIKD